MVTALKTFSYLYALCQLIYVPGSVVKHSPVKYASLFSFTIEEAELRELK